MALEKSQAPRRSDQCVFFLRLELEDISFEKSHFKDFLPTDFNFPCQLFEPFFARQIDIDSVVAMKLQLRF